MQEEKTKPKRLCERLKSRCRTCKSREKSDCRPCGCGSCAQKSRQPRPAFDSARVALNGGRVSARWNIECISTELPRALCQQLRLQLRNTQACIRHPEARPSSSPTLPCCNSTSERPQTPMMKHVSTLQLPSTKCARFPRLPRR